MFFFKKKSIDYTLGNKNENIVWEFSFVFHSVPLKCTINISKAKLGMYLALFVFLNGVLRLNCGVFSLGK